MVKIIKNNPTEYFQNQEDKLFGIYKGVIEDNNDTEKQMGRCKIRIFGVHTPKKVKTETEGIPTNEIPWAEPALGLFGGSVNGIGAWTVPVQGTLVFIFFEQGNILKPRYFATIPGYPTDQNHGFAKEEGFSDPDEVYPYEEITAPHKPNALNEPDYHKLSRGIKTDTIIEYIDADLDTGVSRAGGGTWDEPASSYNTTYPHNNVFSTKSGITIEMDDTPDNERIHIYHPSKTYIEINKDGQFIIRNSNHKIEIVENSKKTHIYSNHHINVGAVKTTKVGASKYEEIGTTNTQTIGTTNKQQIGSDSTIHVGGISNNSVSNTTNIWCGGNINLDGTMIYLNSFKTIERGI